MQSKIRKIFASAVAYLAVVMTLTVSVFGADIGEVYVGGMPFGVKFYSDGIVIVGFTEIETAEGMKNPAYDAGLRVNDIITGINGSEVKSSGELLRLIEQADGAVEVTYIRGKDVRKAKLEPSTSTSDGKKKTGMWIRDTTAGIGTVTYIVPGSGEFAGLGHGICDMETGELLKMERGTVVDVQISGITKGKAGTPGELKGFFTSEKSGVLTKNTICGVYGCFSEIPYELIPEPLIEVGKTDDVHTGEAAIWCTLDGVTPRKYKINIDEVHRTGNRSFSLTVTDRELIEKTGGIVQGMSGSPILQNGKLIGAVTHVLVSDPTKGYGIFIENMFDAAG